MGRVAPAPVLLDDFEALNVDFQITAFVGVMVGDDVQFLALDALCLAALDRQEIFPTVVFETFDQT